MDDNSIKNDFYVYAWLRPCGTPFYIGKGRGSRDRKTFGRNRVFDRIFKKIVTHGGTPKVTRLREGMSEREAFDLEIALIANYGRIDQFGLLANLTDGGEGPSNPSAETRERIAASRRGRPLSEEHRKKISLGATGRTQSAITRDKIRASKRDISTDTRTKLSLAARSISDEHKSKIAASKRNKPARNGYKGVCKHAATGKFMSYMTIDSRKIHIGLFHSEEDAARAYDKAAFSMWGKDCYLNFPSSLSLG